jgi:hypothetical protein
LGSVVVLAAAYTATEFTRRRQDGMML